MSGNEEILIETFHKAFNPDGKEIDLLSVNIMCTLIREKAEAIDKFKELILDKIKSNDLLQCSKALEILGICMSKCGERFLKGVAKFRFLNHILDLVLMNHNGKNTPIEIREKIIDYLSLWSVEYPDQGKIKEAYEKLRTQNYTQNNNTTNALVIPSVARESCFIDSGVEEKIKILINSKNPDDLKRANLLIQYHVEQDAKKTELLLQQKDELKKAENIIDLLNEMLNGTNLIDAKDTLQELYENCIKLRPIIQRLPLIIDEKEVETADEAFKVNDALNDVIKKYEETSLLTSNNDETKQENSEELLSNILENETEINKTENLLPNIIDTNLENVSKEENTEKLDDDMKMGNNIDSLKDILFDFPPVSENLLPLEPLQPVPVFKEKNDDKKEVKSEDNLKNIKTSNNSFLLLVDKLNEQIFQEHLKTGERIGSFKKKPDKVSLNEMKVKTSDENVENCENENENENENLKKKTNENSIEINSPVKTVITEDCKLLDIDNIEFLLSNTKVSNLKIYDDDDDNELNKIKNNENTKSEFLGSEDEEILDDKMISSTSSLNVADISEIKNEILEEEKMKTIKNLSDITLDLKSIKGNKNLRKKVMDDVEGLEIIFNFPIYHLNDDIIVIVISIVNQGQFPIKNLHLDAGVPKPCKLRLLEPTNTFLPGVEPFQHPTEDIKQILLLFNPIKKDVNITCIVSYNLSDDVDPIKEPFIVEKIPYSFD